jgi:5-methylcytosine-specific restriction enzyme subunit McrC
MAVSIDNIYYLLCYAYGHVDDLALAPSGQELAGRTENLFAHVLVATTRRLFQRGISRRYVERDEDVRGVRGKVLPTDLVKRSLLRTGRLPCRFEELSIDLVENQMLKSAASWLSWHPFVSEAHRSRLAEVLRMLGEVADRPLGSIHPRELRVHPPRSDYALGLAVARLLAEGALPRPESASGHFVPFEANAQEMGRLFEDFIRGFITVEIPDHKHLPRQADWSAEGSEADLGLLPKLIRDVPVILGGRRLLIECKFYDQSLATNRFGGQKLRVAHLNQLFAYLVNDVPEAEGLLLHAAAEVQLDAQFEIAGRRIAVKTLNLGLGWPLVHGELSGILRAGARSAL